MVTVDTGILCLCDNESCGQPVIVCQAGEDVAGEAFHNNQEAQGSTEGIHGDA